jgi:cytoskeletal protein RodZ
LSIGQKIKEARESLGLTIDDIKVKTKIRSRYLNALEEDNYDVIPGEAYVKVFIKSYARYVGLDGDELANEYQEIIDQEKKSEEEILNEKQQKKSSLFQNKLFKIVIIIVFIVLIIFTIYNLFINDKTEESKIEELKKDTREISTSINKESNQNVLAELNINNDNTTTTTNNNNNNNELNENKIYDKTRNKEGKIIEVLSGERTWIKIIIDGKEIFQGFMNSGDVKELNVSKEVVFKIGNASAIKVKIDDNILGPWGISGEVINKEIKL